MPAGVPVAIALGSNLGDRRAHLTAAVAALTSQLTDVRVSAFHDTAPEDVDGPQPRYLNAALVGSTTLDPRALLDVLLAIESTRGRTRPSARASRTLDLDLILYDDRVIDEPGLVVPHPAFHRRRFVLAPLREVAPDWRDPRTGQSVADLAAGLKI